MSDRHVRVSGGYAATAKMGKLALLLGSTNRLYVVEQGERDERAKLAFVEGQCHGLAVALHRRMRWVLVAIDDANGDCEHVCVRDQEDRLVDIRGFHPAGAMPVENGVALRDVDEAYVGGLTTLNWSPPDARGAEPWVDGVLALEASPVEDGAPT